MFKKKKKVGLFSRLYCRLARFSDKIVDKLEPKKSATEYQKEMDNFDKKMNDDINKIIGLPPVGEDGKNVYRYMR